jgi:hypothetical protein
MCRGYEEIRPIGANNSARPTARFEPPATAPLASNGLEANCRNRNEQLPHLDRSLLPLALTCRRILQEIEAALATAVLPRRGASAIEPS